MIKHASSHGSSVLLCTIVSAFIVEVIKPLMPDIFMEVQKYSRKIIDLFNIPISVEYCNIILVASLLGLIWGILFKLNLSR